MLLRRPDITDAKILTDLAMRSKAHWGYDTTLLHKWKDELTVTEEFLKSAVGRLAEQNGQVIGFWLREPIQTEQVTNGFLFIEPNDMGKGLGRKLYNALRQDLLGQGVTSFVLEADPNAAPFYKKMGGKQIGEKHSTIVAGRILPILRFDLQS